jgi:O-antigen ligase
MLISLVGVLFFWFGGNIVNKYIYKNHNAESILSTRSILWDARIEAIKEKPYTGWGYNVNEFTYIDKYHQFNKLEKGNTFLAIFEEFGLIFGSILIGLFSFIFYKSFKILKARKTTPYLAVTIVAVLLHSLLETWIFNFYGLLAIVFWTLILASFQKDKGKK